MVGLKKEAFVTITNQDIYEKITQMHDEIKLTNGKVKHHGKLIGILFTFLAIVFVGLIRLASNR